MEYKGFQKYKEKIKAMEQIIKLISEGKGNGFINPQNLKEH